MSIKQKVYPKGGTMNIKTIIAGSASAVVLLTQTAFAGSLAPVVDCNVTPDAPECAVVTLAPATGSSGSAGGLGGAGTAAAIGGGLLAVGLIAAIIDDDDSSSTTTTENNSLSPIR